MWPDALNSCLKSNKLPNLVTLIEMEGVITPAIPAIAHLRCLPLQAPGHQEGLRFNLLRQFDQGDCSKEGRPESPNHD